MITGKVYVDGKFAVMAVAAALLLATPAMATDLTAGAVVKNFSNVELGAFIGGMVEGFAYARYVADGESTTAMRCIYDWYYEGGDATLIEIMAKFTEYGDYTPGAVLSGLIERECGA